MMRGFRYFGRYWILGQGVEKVIDFRGILGFGFDIWERVDF